MYPYTTQTFYDLCKMMLVHFENGKRNGMDNAQAREYAKQQMRDTHEKFMLGWLDSNINSHPAKKQKKDLYPGYPY